MANRFPLVLDTGDGNKIKELPSGDNLNLRESSIVNVQDIDALGTINAADITVNGNRLVAQTFADLTDTPNTFDNAADYFVKVKEDGTGLEFRPFSDIGNIEVEQIEVSDTILPTADNTVDIGNSSLRFRTVTAREFKGDLLANDNTRVFDATTGFVSYAALQGAPQFLSEFTDDIGFLRTNDLDDALGGLFDDGVPFATDIKGSVFADDSTVLVDGTSGKIVGEVDTFIINTSVLTSQVGLGNILITGGPNDFGGDINISGGTGTSQQGGAVNINGGAGVTDAGNINIGQSSSEVRIDGNNLFIGTVIGNINLGRAGATTTAFGVVDFTNAIVNGSLDGELVGSVFYDDSTQIIDAVAGRIVNPIVQGLATFENNVTVDQDLTVLGNLIVQGTTTSIETTNTTITDNIITLNNGEVGAGVTAGTSGIEIDRGSEANKTFVWDDSVDKWTIGSETFVANTVEAVSFQGSLVSTGGVNAPLQIFSGQQGQTGNTIFINPYGSDTFLVQQAETYEWRTGAYLSSGNPYVSFKTAGAFKTHDGAYFEGDLTGDIKGSVFGDDSTVLVDAVNNTIPGTLTGDWNNPGNTFDITGSGLNISTLSSALSFSTTGLSTAFSNGTDNSAYTFSDTGSSLAFSDGVDSTTLSITPSAISLATTGNVTVASSGSVTYSIVGDLSISSNNFTLNTNGVIADLTGDVTGNIDNASLTIGATTATTIAIGNSGSTTTINGTFQIPALVAGSITADDSISITTATGDGNAISIGPGGTNTFVNLTANNIRFFGPITQNINAQAGITGDLTGSVFGDDSTILVDAVNSTIPYGVLDGAPTNLSDFNNDLDYAAIVGTAIQNNGLPVDTFMTGNLDAQGNDIENANLVNATGTLDGDIKGSVFADDSSVMVDAVNFTMFTDAMTLTPLNAEPTQPVSGMLVAADGINWDPAAKVGAVPYPVFYDGVAWNALY